MFKGKIVGYVGRFSLIHVITYLIAGLIFMNVQNYAGAFESSEHLIGVPEVTVQMLAFSYLFYIWEKKVYSKNIACQ